jgi:large subunit ribosomal protein L17
MRKKVFGRKFKRDVNARRALFRSLISSLILKERIQTTEAKAKSIRADVDKLITKVKNGKARNLLSDLLFPHALDKLVNDIAPRFKDRPGGYTRILRVGNRFGDDSSMVLMEWTTGPLPVAPKPVQKIKKTAKPKTKALTEKKTTKSSKAKKPLSKKKK